MTPDTAYNPSTIEPDIYALWEKSGAFQADTKSSRAPYTIVIPPPNVTGSLHMGHAVNNALQDALIRWKRMQGLEACWVPGTDHAGIATQNVVEKEIKKDGLTRWDLGRQEFLVRVWAWKERYGNTILHQLRKLGCSCDWARTRFTMDEPYSRAVRAAFKRLYDKGLVYRGPYIINWCPRCLTALSDIEVEHEKTKGFLWRIRYPFEDGAGHIVVATTRPETMLGDTAVAVNPDDPRYKAGVGRKVRLPLMNRSIAVVADPFVDPSFGTGAVKVTPAHDLNDYEASLRLKLPAIAVIDEKGRMNENAGPYRGLDRFECRKKVVEALTEQGLLEKTEDYEVPVGKCYRCRTVIEPYLSEQWFVKMKPLAAPAIRAAREGRVRFIPERWTRVYLDWLENTRDWCVSRQIWWGHRIPVWTCLRCKAATAVVDTPTSCPACGRPIATDQTTRLIPKGGFPEPYTELAQDPDVLDTWFSSALWPFATLGWPDETPDLKRFYPTQTLVTARDILYLWVARMVMMGLEFLGREPYTEVFINPTIQNPEGKRMSKSLGTGIDPLGLIDQFGADAVRFGLLWQVTDTQDLRFREERIEEARHFANKLWNAARFVTLNAGAGEAPAEPPAGPAADEDRWILSRAQTVIAEVNRALEQYRFGEASQTLYQFLWHEYCDWYIEMVKPRLAPDSRTRGAAMATLVRVLDTALRLLHPFMPFVTEALWRRLREAGLTAQAEGDLLMRAPWPQADEGLVNRELERTLNDQVIPTIRGIREFRNEQGIPPTQPFPKAAVALPSREDVKRVEAFRPLIERLSGTQSIFLDTHPPRPVRSASFTSGMIHGYIECDPNDLQARRGKLRAKLAECAEQLAAERAKLARSEFASKAPREIVEKVHARIAELDTLKTKLEEDLQHLA